MLTPAIRKKIEARYGAPIRYSKDCDGLANSIGKSCQERISVTTLKRLFGFAKKVEQPRLFTLDVIAVYIGYSDWGSLLANIEQTENIGVPTPVKSFTGVGAVANIHYLNHQISTSLTTQTIDIKKVIALCRQLGGCPEIIPFVIEMTGIAARQKNIQFLKQVFDLPNIFDEKKHTFLQLYYLGQSIGLMLRSHPFLVDELADVYGANRKAQHFLIESFVDEDYLQGYYGKLIDAYHTHRKNKAQDKLFYYCLKHSQAQQAGDLSRKNQWYKKIKNLRLPAHIHVIPAARYIGICIAEEPGHKIEKASPYLQMVMQTIAGINIGKASNFIFYLCKELFKAKRTDWIIAAINIYEQQYNNHDSVQHSHLDTLAKNELNIYRSLAKYLQGNKRKALQIFKEIDPNLFDSFIFQQAHKDYLYVAKMIKPKNN